MNKVQALPVAACLALTLLAGCHSGPSKIKTDKDPILKLAATESLTKGKELLTRKKYSEARPYFTHAFEVEPNSKIGREGLLLAADTFYMEGGNGNFIQAEAKYRDYLNRFPTSDQAAYVQFQIANSLSKRIARADRDQTVTRKALDAYQELVRQYPTSEYAGRAQGQTDVVKNDLAEHEFVIGYFYLRYGAPLSAATRFEYLLENYPAYNSKDKVLFNLGLAYQRSAKPDEAKKAFDRLRTEFPQSKLAHNIPEYKAPVVKTPTPPPATAAKAGA
jgi:outer membrane protein assembly factor BamD